MRSEGVRRLVRWAQAEEASDLTQTLVLLAIEAAGPPHCVWCGVPLKQAQVCSAHEDVEAELLAYD